MHVKLTGLPNPATRMDGWMGLLQTGFGRINHLSVINLCINSLENFSQLCDRFGGFEEKGEFWSVKVAETDHRKSFQMNVSKPKIITLEQFLIDPYSSDCFQCEVGY